MLPPANEVRGKVIFSEACVKNSVHRGGGACSGGSAPGGGVPALGGVPAPGGSAPGGDCSGGGGVENSPVTATAACGTHPTGMHSCYRIC